MFGENGDSVYENSAVDENDDDECVQLGEKLTMAFTGEFVVIIM